MNETARIADQLARSLRGEAWHGPSLMELLDGVSAAQAAQHPIAGAHSIGELVLHVTAWQDAIRRRLSGDPAQLSTAEDWPPFGGDASGWSEALDALRRSTDLLMAACGKVPEPALDEPILPGFSSRYVSLHGAVQHNLYHAGQIALLRRALGSPL